MAGRYARLGDDLAPNIVGGKAASVMFVVMLLAFVIESQLTQYVQSQLDFRQPYLLFYIAHSAMAIVLPLHLLFLHLSTSISASVYLRGLSAAAKQLLHGSRTTDVDGMPFPTSRFLRLLLWCTIGITIPGLLWFAAITLASVSDVTALWNCNAFWAYVILVKIKKAPLQPRRLAPVVIASIGVFAVVYGSGAPQARASDPGSTADDAPKAPLMGNLLTLVASFGYGLYQVLYKIHATLPNGPDVDSSAWRRLSISSASGLESPESELGALAASSEETGEPLPFGLFANMLTTGMGAMTLCALWIPLPILHYTAVEPFSLPSNFETSAAVVGIALSGVVFYMSFMILLGVWGPVVTSVGNLLTIVLVMISDVLLGNAVQTLTMWSLVGSSMIVCAFAVLAYETFRG